jgi:hypothetical protein
MKRGSVIIECFNAFSIDNINFIIVKSSDNVITEKMMTNEEIKNSSIQFVQGDCSNEIKNYLKGL